MRKQLLYLVIAIVLILLVGIFYLNNQNRNYGLKICPDDWIKNEMPLIADSPDTIPREYFIIKSERKEIRDYDLDWIKANCDISPQSVY
jgi:hypothetical protein